MRIFAEKRRSSAALQNAPAKSSVQFALVFRITPVTFADAARVHNNKQKAAPELFFPEPPNNFTKITAAQAVVFLSLVFSFHLPVVPVPGHLVAAAAAAEHERPAFFLFDCALDLQVLHQPAE